MRLVVDFQGKRATRRNVITANDSASWRYAFAQRLEEKGSDSKGVSPVVF